MMAHVDVNVNEKKEDHPTHVPLSPTPVSRY